MYVICSLFVCFFVVILFVFVVDCHCCCFLLLFLFDSGRYWLSIFYFVLLSASCTDITSFSVCIVTQFTHIYCIRKCNRLVRFIQVMSYSCFTTRYSGRLFSIMIIFLLFFYYNFVLIFFLPSGIFCCLAIFFSYACLRFCIFMGFCFVLTFCFPKYLYYNCLFLN